MSDPMPERVWVGPRYLGDATWRRGFYASADGRHWPARGLQSIEYVRADLSVALTDDRVTAAALAACAAFSDTLDLDVRPAVLVNPVAAVMAVEGAIRDALSSRAK